MSLIFDNETGLLVGGVIAVLILASLIGWVLARRPGSAGYQATIANLNARTRAWWLMVAIFFLAMLSGGIGSVILFGLISFLALREFITMTPTRTWRPWHIAVALLRDYPHTIRARCHRMVWALRHFHSGVRFSVRSAAQCSERRLRALFGTDCHDPMGANDLRLLRQPRPGASDLGDSWF